MNIRKSAMIISLLFSQLVLGANILQNPSFEKPLSKAIPNNIGTVNTEGSWIKYENSGGIGDIEIINGDLVAISKNTKAPTHGLQVIQAPLKLEAGGIYQLKFKANVEKETEITIKIGADGERGYYGYWQKDIKISPKQKEYTFDFEMLAEVMKKQDLNFGLQKQMKL